MYRFIVVIAASTALVAAGSRALGGEQCGGAGQLTCPHCHHCCVLKAECGEEEKSCWEIECEEICIPRVVFPWQKWKAKRDGSSGSCDACDDGCGSCCTVNNGARVKVVKKLKKKTYECPKCQYEWTPACGAQSGCSSCGQAACCDADCDAADPEVPAPAVEAEKQQQTYLFLEPAFEPEVAAPQLSARRSENGTVATRSLRDTR